MIDQERRAKISAEAGGGTFHGAIFSWTSEITKSISADLSLTKIGVATTESRANETHHRH